MRFIVDAQLPRLLADHLAASGHDVVHVKQLPKAGETSDAEISAFADRDNRIVVTKDTDFQEAHLLRGTPRRLLRVATGNIRAPFPRILPRNHAPQTRIFLQKKRIDRRLLLVSKTGMGGFVHRGVQSPPLRWFDST